MPLALLAFLGPVLSGASSASPAHRWSTYANTRFGYTLCYPADLLRPQPESDNGDGRVFRGGSGEQLRVWGQYNALDQSLVQAMQQHEARLAAGRARISYRARGANWYVLSGRAGAQVFYARTRLSGDRFASFELTYRAADAAAWQKIVVRISGCLAN
jgi:hypothetical protein